MGDLDEPDRARGETHAAGQDPREPILSAAEGFFAERDFDATGTSLLRIADRLEFGEHGSRRSADHQSPRGQHASKTCPAMISRAPWRSSSVALLAAPSAWSDAAGVG